MDEAKRATTLKRDALGRVGTKKEQREALLDEFERSGLKGAQFARLAGIKYQTFAGWVQQRRHARGDYAGLETTGQQAQPSALRLVEAVLAAPAVAESAAMTSVAAPALEVHLPGGSKLLIATTHQAILAAHLLQALRAPC